LAKRIVGDSTLVILKGDSNGAGVQCSNKVVKNGGIYGSEWSSLCRYQNGKFL
jgi:ketosteroid isomerase-like protein